MMCYLYVMTKRNTSIYDDLISHDGQIKKLKQITADWILQVSVDFNGLSPSFVGFSINPKRVIFNLKSTLAQLGVESKCLALELIRNRCSAHAEIELIALNELGKSVLKHLEVGTYIGKLFAADPERLVRKPIYLTRMFEKTDHFNSPLLSFGKIGKETFCIKTVDGRAVAYLPTKKGSCTYDQTIFSLVPTIAKSLKDPSLSLRTLLKSWQKWNEKDQKQVKPKTLLLVKTEPLHLRTVFARVVNSLLPEGFTHTSASILDHTTKESRDIYELYGDSTSHLKSIPLEFYCLHPYKEHVFFSHRDQLLSHIKNPAILFNAMLNAPKPLDLKCSTFIVKSSQLLSLTSNDWVKQTGKDIDRSLPSEESIHTLDRVRSVAKKDPSYFIIENIEKGEITSEGILLSRYFPSLFLKSFLLNATVLEKLKQIYFEIPSQTDGIYFSFLDRSFLIDLYRMGISTFWLDKTTENILQFAIKSTNESGMFVPIDKVKTFQESTMIGVYGSHIIRDNVEHIVSDLLSGLLQLKMRTNHPLLNPSTPLSLVTGGGMGAMDLGNQKAKELGILSCGQLVDFRVRRKGKIVHEETPNPHIEAKMTYRLEQLVERQSDFRLDFPIFLKGGFGTDFEFFLEQLRRNFPTKTPTPVLLIGPKSYWESKITPIFQTNLKNGTIPNFKWVSNCFYCIQNAKEGLSIYEKFANKTLPIGREGPVYEEGFKAL